MNGNLTLLLLTGSSICLVGLITSFFLLTQGQQRVRLRGQRIDQAIDAYRMSSAGGAGKYRLLFEQRGESLIQRAERFVRYDRAHQAMYSVKPKVVLPVCLLLALVFVRICTNFIGPTGWLTVPVTWVFLIRWFYGWRQDRYTATLFRQFPDALAMIVRTVRVGLPIVEALRMVARESSSPTAEEFAALVAQTSIGVPLDDALREMAERNRLPEYRFFATALSLQAQTGGGLAETLDNLAETIRKRLAARLRGHALAAEARMSSYILGALPIVAGILLTLTNYNYISVLFTDAVGQKLLMAAIGLLSLGAWTMRVLIRKSLT